ncbi:MAG: AMP-binding protein, partial [Candidatus Kapaibacterium sp.]
MDTAKNIRSAHSLNGSLPATDSFRFLSIAAALEHLAAAQADAPYLISVDEHGGRNEYTYGRFRENVLRCASNLHEHGVRRGTRIVSAAHNHEDTVILLFAAWCIGACVVPLNMTEDDDRLRFIIGDCDAVLAVVRPDYDERVRPMCDDAGLRCVTVDDPQYVVSSTTSLYTCADDSFLDDECLIVYTSGTTGKPKGVVLVQRNLMADGEGIAAWHGIDPGQERSDEGDDGPVDVMNGQDAHHAL